MALYLGFDTSNYRTSVAVYDREAGVGANFGRLLPVERGALGLRQSDAVFAHIRQLPELSAALRGERGLRRERGGTYAAVSASVAPRDAENSYMPCFLVGETAARVAADTLRVPFYAFSHQQGHLAAAAYSAGCLDMLKSPFLAWHLSGGTTELLYVEPGGERLLRCARIGGTTDIAAGQLVDRTGVLMGLPFPAGPELSRLSGGGTSDEFYRVRVKESAFSLSGVENQVKERIAAGVKPADVAGYALRTIRYAIHTATAQAAARLPGLPILCAGGVMSNDAIRESLARDFGARTAEPALSGDNALGVAILGAIRQEGGF